MKKENDHSDSKGGVMTKHRTLKAVGFFVVLAAILAFLALPDSQAGAGKPIRWKATVTGVNLIGLADFTGGVDNVNINSGVATDQASGDLYGYIELRVFDPSFRFFMDPSAFSGSPDDHPLYGLPHTSAPWPLCIADFLNTYDQPTEEYPYILLRFTTCGCGNTITDFMKMTDGQMIPVRMSVGFYSHAWGCPASSNTFLNLDINAHGWYKQGTGSDPDIYIQKVGNVWTASVNTVFDNPAYQEPLPDSALANWPVTLRDSIIGQYATCDPGPVRKGKTRYITTYHYPWAKAPLNFQITFTKY